MKNLNPFVSILITNYNFEKFISDSIRSAVNQVNSLHEIIVVDDGSSDNSRDVINNFNNKVIPIYKENGGQASAWNAGYQFCQVDIVCLLDSDDIFLPGKVSKVVKRMSDDNGIGWYFNRHKFVDIVTGNVLAFTPLKATGICDARNEIIKGHNPLHGPATSGLCFRSSLLDQIFPIPEEVDNSITEEYLRVVALYLAKGYMDTEPLSIKREHGANKFSSKSIKEKLPLLARKKISN
jgi:glycosyltransferase involved in cell wall biosynthesis